MALEPLSVDRHPSRIELEDWWFAQQPQPPGAPTVERAAADLLEIGQHVTGCGDCGAALAALEDERRAFLDAHPLDDLLGDAPIDAPAPANRLRWLLPLVAVLALGFFLGTWVTGGSTPQDEPGLRPKGGGATVQVTDTRGAPITPVAGDVVRFSVRLETPGYPLLVVVQADGATSVAYPPDLHAQRAVPAGEPLLLPGAAALDGYAGREEVRMWVAESPWTDAAIEERGAEPLATTVLREAP